MDKKDFFLSSFFEYENQPCVCKKETVYSVPGEDPHYNVKVCATNGDAIKFSYMAQKGLNHSGNAGGIISENILGQLLAIPIDDLDATLAFFEKYGFLFPISDAEYESVDDHALLEIVNRIKATVKLMGTIAGKRDYKNMLILTTYLLYGDVVELNLSSQPYSSCRHPFRDLLESYYDLPDTSRNQEIFDTGYYTVTDTLCPDGNKISRDDLISMAMGDGIWNVAGSKEEHFKHLFALYTNYKGADEELRTIIDFYYHYQKEVGVFSGVAVNRLAYHGTPQRENFTDTLKEALLKVAKIVITEELNAHLQYISPQFDSATLSPSWKLHNFLSALYFSIFYMKPGVELYKECENPNCKNQKYFLINATVTNKKYCCTACANAAAQRRARARKMNK